MNELTKLKVGIAGFGVVGKRRRVYIDQHPKMKTVAVCDINFDKPQILEEGIIAYEDYKNLLKEDLDILFVCLPNYLAPEVTIAGLNSGLHVFCEKPPGRNVQDIKDVIEVEKQNPSLVLKYGFNHRYHESVLEALQIIRSGELGQLLNLKGTYGKSRIVPFSGGWRAQREYSGGGILLDQGIHMLDLMRLFAGNFPEVKSFVSNEFWNHDVEDNAYAIMRNKNGVIAMLHSSATHWQHRFLLNITLTEGSIELTGLLTGSKSYGEETMVVRRRGEDNRGTLKKETYQYLDDNTWSEEIREFAGAIFENKEIKFGSSQDALETMELVYDIYFDDKSWTNKFNINR
jgi:predicted dehydrogenase